MTDHEFSELLREKNYDHGTDNDGRVIVRHQEYVYLNTLTTLPAGVKFENQGAVYLRSLTTLPAGVQFLNRGCVDLRRLATLPAGVTFTNHGAVYLHALTTLPAGVRFENHGAVELRSLSGKVRYRGKTLELAQVDGYTMVLGDPKTDGESTDCRARYFGGGRLQDLKKCYVTINSDD